MPEANLYKYTTSNNSEAPLLCCSYFRTAAVLTVIFLISSWFTTAFIAYNNSHNPRYDALAVCISLDTHSLHVQIIVGRVSHQ
jgi:hypothetical protein